MVDKTHVRPIAVQNQYLYRMEQVLLIDLGHTFLANHFDVVVRHLYIELELNNLQNSTFCNAQFILN